MTVKKIGIDVSLTGAEKVEGQLKSIGTTGQATATKIESAFTKGTTDAMRFQRQLDALRQSMTGLDMSSAKAVSALSGAAATTRLLGESSGATAVQMEQLAAVEAQLAGTAKAATASTTQLAGANKALAVSHKVAAESALTHGTALGLMERMMLRMVLAYAAYKTISAAVETVKQAAQYEMLGIAMNTVGMNAGYSANQMRAFEKAITGPMGVSLMGARNVLTQMAGAHLDLAKSAQLSRMAQDVGKAANINSTEAFERMIQAIVSGQPKMLRTMHVLVSFSAAYREFAKENKIAGRELTETEKIAARLNVTLGYGKNFMGVYEEAFKTAGSQMLSAKRYADNARVSIGSIFLPQITWAVMRYADALKAMSEHASTAAGIITALGVATTLLIVKLLAAKGVWATIFLTPISPVTMGIVAVAAAVGILIKKLNDAKKARDELSERIAGRTDEHLERTRVAWQGDRDRLASNVRSSLSGTGTPMSVVAAQKEIARLDDMLRNIELEQANRARARAQEIKNAKLAADEANDEQREASAKATAAQLKKNQAALDKRVGGVIPDTIREIANQRAETQAIREKTAAIAAGGEAKDKQRIKEAGDLAFASKMADLDKERTLSAEQGTTISKKQAEVYAVAARMARESAEANERMAVAEDHAKERVKASTKAYDAYMDAIVKPIRALGVKRDALERMSLAQKQGKEATEAERIALAGEAAARGVLNASLENGLDFYLAITAAMKAMRLAEGNERIVIANEKVAKAVRDAEQITNRMWRGVQEGLANSIENGFKDGLNSARGFVDALKSMLINVFSQALAAGITGKLRGQGGSFMSLSGLASEVPMSASTPNVANASVSGIGSKMNWGVAIGGVVGLVSAAFDLGKNAKQAARDVKAMGLAIQQSLDAKRFELGLISKKDKDLADAKAWRDAQILAVQDKANREKDKINANFFTTRWAKDTAKGNIDAETQRAIDEINRLYGINITAINNSTDAFDKLTASALNAVAGYKYQATIFQAANGRVSIGPESATRFTGRRFDSSAGGNGNSGGGADQTVTLVLADGTPLGKAVLKNFKGTAVRQFGDSSRWSEIQ